jgi:hypothetical protein
LSFKSTAAKQQATLKTKNPSQHPSKMSQLNDSVFLELKEVLKSMVSPKLGLHDRFYDDHTYTPLLNAFSIPVPARKLNKGEAAKKAAAIKKAASEKSEAAESKTEEAVTAAGSKKRKAEPKKQTPVKSTKGAKASTKNVEVESKAEEKPVEKKKKKSAASKFYGCFGGIEVAAAYMYELCQQRLLSGKTQVIISLDLVIEFLAIAVANKCSEPQEAIIPIRKLAQYAAQVHKRSEYAWNGGSVNILQAFRYRDNDSFVTAFSEACKLGYRSCFSDARTRLVEDTKKREEKAKKEKAKAKKAAAEDKTEGKESPKPAAGKGKRPSLAVKEIPAEESDSDEDVTDESNESDNESSDDEPASQPVKKQKGGLNSLPVITDFGQAEDVALFDSIVAKN